MRDLSRTLQLAVLALCAGSMLSGESGGRAATSGPTADPGWPRQYTDGTAKLVLHQPQVESWKDFKKLSALFAVALTPAKGAPTVFGVLTIESDTAVSLETRTIGLTNFRVTEVSFPSAKDDEQNKTWEALAIKLMPEYPTQLALDRVVAYLDKNQVPARETPVLLDPPPILVSTQPAVLVIIDGDPVPFDIDNTELQKIANTNWDLFVDKKSSRYYLRDDKVWLSAKGLTEAWIPVDKLPNDFKKLPANDQFKEVKLAAERPQKPTVVKLALVVNKPAELIVIDGEPLLQLIPGTNLKWVTNTECDLFLDAVTNQYYFLTSGRWFRSADLKSRSWTAATTLLPDEFKKIPPDHPRGHVLSAVPGTRQAEEAIVAASIPQTATVDRKSIKAEVKYVGEPKFEPIEGTGVSYASNSPNDVFLVADRYYVCLDGVWLTSAAANGPWEAAEKVPDEIYAIPPSSSKYNVTYVKVYESTPETVTYGYTAGYTGIYIGYGVAMWGTGYYYPPYYGWGYYPYPVYWPAAYYTYGASAWYNPATGAYGRGSAVYGPYGGYARGAAFNPATGRYSWGQTAWGPYGAAASGGFYNPNTGAWGGTYRASNGYQSWGQSVVARGDQWARTGSYSDSRGTVAGVKTSEGGKAIAARGSQGQGFAAKSGAGDFYAGKDGNVYKRDQSGQWYKNNNGSWDPMSRPSQGAGQEGRAGQGFNRDSVQNGLNRDASARNWGNYNTQRTESAQRSRSWSSGGWTGNRSSGWSMRSGGFGRRR
ncbi:MAG TPA: hypothetical protein VGF59_32645 [Bryobacteraceae bacterium]